MPGIRQGSIHLFRLKGVDVFLHWSWFLVAVFEIGSRSGKYSSIVWNILEYLALFLIVLLHEFGHALACRQVGGTANRIMLWPLGGVAYVNPPQRPGATLWSIAAGPLVNVGLFPVLWAAFAVAKMSGWAYTMPDVYYFLRAVFAIDIGLLAFNIMPVYPLDGGQILRSLLWFPMGRARSLMAASIVGFLGVGGFVCLAFWWQSPWLGLISAYMLLSCWGGFKQAQALIRFERLPRREGFACPSCRMAPLLGVKWHCEQCDQAFDAFETHAVCPHCATRYATTTCLDCGEKHPIDEWMVGSIAGVGVLSGSIPPR